MLRGGGGAGVSVSASAIVSASVRVRARGRAYCYSYCHFLTIVLIAMLGLLRGSQGLKCGNTLPIFSQFSKTLSNANVRRALKELALITTLP